MEAVFFDTPCGLDREGTNTCTEWHKHHRLLASATAAGLVDVYDDEGERVSSFPTLGAGTNEQAVPLVTALAWHPHDRLLAVGFSTGRLVLWPVMREAGLQANADVHEGAAVTCVRWSLDATRLITGDADGKCAVWVVELGQFLADHQYNFRAAVTHLVPRSSAALGVSEPLAFFVATRAGGVYLADGFGRSSEAFTAGGPLRVLLYDGTAANVLVAITTTLVFSRYMLDEAGALILKMKAKMASASTEAASLRGVWTLPGLLATCANESLVRMFNTLVNENYALSLADVEASGASTTTDRVTCLAFHPAKQCLAAGTVDGRVVFWRFCGATDAPSESERDWEVIGVRQLAFEVVDVAWGPGGTLLAATLTSGLAVLVESPMQHAVAGSLVVTQFARTWLALETRSSERVVKVELPLRIAGLAAREDSLLVWSGKRAVVYTVALGPPISLALAHEFDAASRAMALHSQTVIMLRDNKVLLANLSGTTKETLSFAEGEGQPRLIALTGDWLAVLSDLHVLKMWDLSRRKAHQVLLGRQFSPLELFTEVRSLAVNADGSRVTMLGNEAALAMAPASRIVCYEVESDRVTSCELGPLRYPLFQTWDATERRLLAIQTRLRDWTRARSAAAAAQARVDATPDSPSSAAGAGAGASAGASAGAGDASGSGPAATSSAPSEALSPATKRRQVAFQASRRTAAAHAAECEVTTLFATPDQGLVPQHSFALDASMSRMLGICVPHVLVGLRPPADGAAPLALRSKAVTMRDFVGMETDSAATRAALLDFSYYLTVGAMDDAFKAVRVIASDTVWQNMAAMCVKTRRLDVAELCLANMGHLRGLRALREARKLAEPAAQVAMLAIQLGLLEDAEALLVEAGRYDLLNTLYQNSNQWKQAVDIARGDDRVHLRTTFYAFGKYLESVGDTASAVQAYERAGLVLPEVTRLLLADLPALERYVTKAKSPALDAWWAQLAEVNGALDKALVFYQKAGDVRRAVKVLCQREDFARAGALCMETRDKAACYLLGRQLEARGQTKEALHFYELSGRYNHAIQLAMHAGLDATVLNMALHSDVLTRIEAARYFEHKGVADKAVVLYHRGGRTAKAVDLAFATEQFDALRDIASSLDASADPELLNRCATFFLNHAQFEKAVAMLVAAGRLEQALDLAVEEKIAISETMAESLIPPKTVDAPVREAALTKLGRVLAQQGSYHVACKMYTMAGDKVAAMKCLLKSGDSKRIVFYANVAKSKAVYILAANYLQATDWAADAEVRRAILDFYAKAASWDSYARFCDACAQLEIREYSNFEQALAAWQNAMRAVEPLNSTQMPDRDTVLASLRVRAESAQLFLAASANVMSNPEQTLAACQTLLQRGSDCGVPPGYALELLVAIAVQRNDLAQALRFLRMMRERSVDIKAHLDRAVVERICSANGVALSEFVAVPSSGPAPVLGQDVDDGDM